MKRFCDKIRETKDWLFHEHISRKILTVFVVFFLFSFFLTYSLYSWASKNQADDLMERSSRQLVNTVKNNLDEMVLNVNDDFNLLLKGGTLDVVNHLPRPEDRKSYDNTLFTVLDSNHYLESIYLLDFSAHLYGIDKHDMKRLSVDSTLKCPWYQKVLDAGGSYILENEAGGVFYKGYNSRFVSVIRAINSLETQKAQGFIIMNISESAIEGIFNTAAGNNQIAIGLIDRKGSRIAGNSKFRHKDSLAELVEASGEENLYLIQKEDGMLLSVLYLPDYDWHLIAEASILDKTGGFGDLFLVTSLIFLVNVILMLICSLYIAKSVSNPIYELIDVMNSVKDRDFHKIPVEYPKSEIGILQQNYNNMVGEISTLLSRLVEEQQMKQKMELHALFEQVKPHFLYNTLDAIGYMALTGSPDQTYEAIETLGSFYRQSLNIGEQMIPVKKEVAIVSDYVTLLKLRYGELFEVEYEIDRECSETILPHLILQPLVENAVYHGIKPRGGDGLIQVKIRFTQPDKLMILVKDNGVGIDKKTLSMLQDFEQIRDSNIDVSGTGIGLIGTIQRIVLIYGTRASWQIQSEPGGGTEIVFSLPVTDTGDGKNADGI